MNGRYSRPTPTPPLVLHHLDTLLHLRWNLHCRWVLSSPATHQPTCTESDEPRSREHQKMSTWRNKKQQIQYHNAAMSWKMHIQIQDHKHMARKCWKNLYSYVFSKEGNFIVDVPQLSGNPLLQADKGTCGKDPFSFSMFPFSFATVWPHLNRWCWGVW